jgi:hypothetical protein
MARDPSLFPLKILVISLGVLLLGGMVLIFTTIAMRASKDIHASHCAEAVFHMQGLGTVTSTSAEGDTVEITLAKPNKTTLLSVDRCSGKVLRSFTVEP